MEEGIRVSAEGKCEMPLQFKDRPGLPGNRKFLAHYVQFLKRRFEKNKQYYQDYVAFMSEKIAFGDTEKVPEDQIYNSPV